jgi:hypothetical protein
VSAELWPSASRSQPSSTRSASSRATPPEDGGAIVTTVYPRHVPTRGARSTGVYAARSAGVTAPPVAAATCSARGPVDRPSPPVLTHRFNVPASSARTSRSPRSAGWPPTDSSRWTAGYPVRCSAVARWCPTTNPSSACAIAGAATSARLLRPNRRTSSARPRGSPGTATAVPPSWASVGSGWPSRRYRSGLAPAGATSRKSNVVSGRPERCTTAKPPPPSPEPAGCTTPADSAAATAPSTALPPRANTAAPAADARG